jgi:uncharacterized protein (TIRG00374 family)
MKKFLIALVLLLIVVFILTRFAELNQILGVLGRGNLLYLGLALIVEMLWIYNLGAFNQSVYHVLGMPVTRLHMTWLTTAANVLSVVAPSVGLSTVAVYLADGQQHGRSPAKVTVAMGLYVWFEYIGTLCIAIFGLAELSRRNSLHWVEIAASLILLAGALGIGALLYIGLKSTRLLERIMAWGIRTINRALRPLLHRNRFEEEQATHFSAELAEGLAVLRSNPRWIGWPLFYTLMNKALLVVILAMCFLAFETPVDIGTLVSGISITQLFLLVSPTPSGIGIVEGILTVALNGLGVPFDNATVITLAYRFYSFWIPLLVGSIMLRVLSREKQSIAPVQTETTDNPKGYS